MKALLLHVGADSTDFRTLRVNAPIFDGELFEFIPIVEFWGSRKKYAYIRKKNGKSVVEYHGDMESIEVWTEENRAYSDALSRNNQHGKTLADFIPSEYNDVVMHFDPDFENMTYGDRENTSKGKQISRLKHGDYLFFVSSLVPFEEETYAFRTASHMRDCQKGRMAKYVIGFFKVQESYYALKFIDDDYLLLSSEISHDVMARIKQNAHTKRTSDEYHIVVGDLKQSALLPRAVKLTENGSPFNPSPIGFKVYGNKCFPRGFKWVYNTDGINYLLELASCEI